jgi:NADPH oxidase
MGENWFQREFLVRRRLAFNIIFHGTHIALFAAGWYLQASQFDYLLSKSKFR